MNVPLSYMRVQTYIHTYIHTYMHTECMIETEEDEWSEVGKEILGKILVKCLKFDAARKCLHTYVVLHVRTYMCCAQSYAHLTYTCVSRK